MAVRRLAPDHQQPKNFAFSNDNSRWATRKLNDYPEGRQASAVIPLMMRAQEQEGWVSKPAIETIAQMLDMPFIRVLEVATFYTQFHLKPVGREAHVQVCGTTPCMLRGADDLKSVCRRRIGDQFEVTSDGALSWEEVECLGACVNAPMISVGADTYEDLDVERFEAILDAFAAGQRANVPTGPQIDRFRSAPEGGLTTLLDDPTAERPHPHHGAPEDPPATEAGRPDTFAPIANPATKTPVDADTAEEAAEAAEHGDVDDEAPVAKGVKEGRPAVSARQKGATGPSGPSSKRARDASVDVSDDPEPMTGVRPMATLVSEAQGEVGRPPAVEKPAEPDNLQLISGVGPKIEGILNGLGIWTFAQIAAWTDVEQTWVDGYLRFRGRIQRDDWVRQADALARGGGNE